jgi:hypothetical protein
VYSRQGEAHERQHERMFRKQVRLKHGWKLCVGFNLRKPNSAPPERLLSERDLASRGRSKVCAKRDASTLRRGAVLCGEAQVCLVTFDRGELAGGEMTEVDDSTCGYLVRFPEGLESQRPGTR